LSVSDSFHIFVAKNRINDKNITQPHKGNNKSSVLSKKDSTLFL